MSRFSAYVWWCGDEVCDCYQAQIVELNGPASQYPRGEKQVVWQGTFVSGDNFDLPRRELNQAAKKMRKHWNEAYHAIKWPWNR